MLSSGSGSRRLAVECVRGSIGRRAGRRWLESIAPPTEGKNSVGNAWLGTCGELWEFDALVVILVFIPINGLRHASNTATINRQFLIVHYKGTMTKLYERSPKYPPRGGIQPSSSLIVTLQRITRT